MFTLKVMMSIVIQGLTVQQSFVHQDKFPTEQACYANAINDAPDFLAVVEKVYGPEIAKTMTLDPKCIAEGDPT